VAWTNRRDAARISQLNRKRLANRMVLQSLAVSPSVVFDQVLREFLELVDTFFGKPRSSQLERLVDG
jgi:hypothetical protein